MPDLALFDFDGTVSREDTFSLFIRHAVAPGRLAWGRLAFAPLVAAYKIGLLSATRLRRAIVFVGLRGRRADDLNALGAAFARETVARVLRPEMITRMRWHKARGDTVVVVSASLSLYLRPWCDEHQVALLCSELQIRDGTATGHYLGEDCTGIEKVIRVRRAFELARFNEIYAYGDSLEDRELLELAQRRTCRGREMAPGEHFSSNRLGKMV